MMLWVMALVLLLVMAAVLWMMWRLSLIHI